MSPGAEKPCILVSRLQLVDMHNRQSYELCTLG
jgi:hypothetical protein